MALFDHASREALQFIDHAQIVMPCMLYLILGLWLLNIINWFLGAHLNRLGIYPRKPYGLLGILFAPFLHADFNHLFFNSIPLFLLGLFIMTLGLEVYIIISFIIILLSGFGVWCVGRKGVHLGASGVIAGYFSFIMMMAYDSPSFVTYFLAGIALYYFGGILFSLLPTNERTSWEGHLTGFIAGLIALPLYSYLMV